jgi:hypothetical protein
MTQEENTIKARFKRFKACQKKVKVFISFARHAQAFSNELSKDKVMNGNVFGVDYPFTQKQTNDGNSRPSQIALELGWKYQGQGEAEVNTFFKKCLAIPLSLYYVEDKFK